MTSLRRTWEYESNNIGLYHNPITGSRFATVNNQEIIASHGVSSYQMDLYDRFDFQVSKGVVATIIISAQNTFGSFEYQCMINGGPCLKDTLNFQYTILTAGAINHNDKSGPNHANHKRIHHKENAIHRKLRKMKQLNPSLYSLDKPPSYDFELRNFGWSGLSKMVNYMTGVGEFSRLLPLPSLIAVAL